MKIFGKTQILEMAESDIFCGKTDADHDAAIESLLQLFFDDITSLPCPKNGLQNPPEKPVVNALFRKPLRANGDCDVTETHLKKVLIKQLKKNGKLLETTPRTQRNNSFCKHEKSAIFGILDVEGPHENFCKAQI